MTPKRLLYFKTKTRVANVRFPGDRWTFFIDADRIELIVAYERLMESLRLMQASLREEKRKNRKKQILKEARKL